MVHACATGHVTQALQLLNLKSQVTGNTKGDVKERILLNGHKNFIVKEYLPDAAAAAAAPPPLAAAVAADSLSPAKCASISVPALEILIFLTGITSPSCRKYR